MPSCGLILRTFFDRLARATSHDHYEDVDSLCILGDNVDLVLALYRNAACWADISEVRSTSGGVDGAQWFDISNNKRDGETHTCVSFGAEELEGEMTTAAPTGDNHAF